MSDWPQVRIGDLGRVVTGKTPSTAVLSNFGGPFPFITIPDLDGRVMIDNAARTLSATGAATIRPSLLPPGSVMMSCIATVGRCGITTAPRYTNQQINALIPHNGVSARFVYYAFRLLGEALEDAGGGGSIYTNVSKGRFSELVIPLPSEEEQRCIAGTLSALDDKIELNRRMSETLEAMAQAIFRDWFVDFGPVRRKLEGTTDPVAIMGGLMPDPARAAELAALFPEALGEDELPVGWEVDRLGSIADLQNGYAFKSSDWSDSGVPVIKIGSVKPGFVELSSASFVSPTLAEERASFRLSPGDMVVGLTGYVGETGRVPIVANPPLLNQRVARFRPKQGMSAAVFTAVRDVAFKMFAESKSHGSAQPNVSTKDLLNFPIVLGNEAILDKFDLLTGPMFDHSLSVFQENALLAEIRDYLLPRLMSGEVRVGDLASGSESAGA